MAFLLHQVYLLAMAGLSPVMLIGSYLSERGHGRKASARQRAAYREHKARIEPTPARRWRPSGPSGPASFPDPATVLSIASGPRRRLWERRRTDPDYLLLRVGTADLPSAVELTDPEQDEHRRQVIWLIPDAPVTISLPERGVIGVAGPGDAPRAIGRWLVAQAAALHSPNDLQVYLLTDSSGQASWEWARWLPHCRPAAGQDCAMLIGNDAESVATGSPSCSPSSAPGSRRPREAGRREARFRPDIVVVFDGSRKLRSLPGAVQLLQEGPQVGVYAVCLDADERLLPAECQAVVVVEPDGLRVQQAMADTVRQVRPGHGASRAGAAAGPVHRARSGTSATPMRRRCCRTRPGCWTCWAWSRRPPAGSRAAGAADGRSTLAMIGESYDGPFGIDLRKDGPHALIAGTTGSGKSELLQTIVASLAVANRPDEMTFVLVDYKGGSAFAELRAAAAHRRHGHRPGPATRSSGRWRRCRPS